MPLMTPQSLSEVHLHTSTRPLMLSFPAQNWQKALRATKASLDPSGNAAFGRLASQITPRIYLSDYWSARDTAKLKGLGITHIISVLDFAPDLPEIIPQDRRFHVALADDPEARILDHLDATTAFILKALSENDGNKVLVHCMQGISRSATVVCAYLVATTDLTAPKSIEHVQSIRGIVCPNLGFRRQLDEYSTQYVKSKPRPPQISLPDVFKTRGGGIAVRIRKLREASGKAS